MKALLLFHDQWMQYGKADWIASRIPVAAFLVVKKSRPWIGRYLWKRAMRLGFQKVLDEVLLRAYWLLFQGPRDHLMIEQLLDEVKKDIPKNYKRPPIYLIDDINSAESEVLLKQLAPDVCMLMLHPIIKERIVSIPRFGMLVFHPGIVPEYRGVHCAFWATLNREFWGIGWSLLRIDTGIDTGKVLAQGSAEVDPLSQTHIFMQHKAHVDGLPQVVQILGRLEAGENPIVPTAGRRSTNYTHPGLSDYIKLRKSLKRLRLERPSIHRDGKYAL